MKAVISRWLCAHAETFLPEYLFQPHVTVSASILLQVPTDNCSVCQLITEEQLQWPRCLTYQHKSTVIPAKVKVIAARWLSLSWHHRATRAQILLSLRCPAAPFLSSQLQSLSHSLRSRLAQVRLLLWEHAVKCWVIHNVLWSSSQMLVSTLIAPWAVVWHAFLAWQTGR